MTTFSDLTPAQQGQILAYVANYRVFMGHLAKTLAEGQALVDSYNLGVADLLGGIDADVAIEGASNLPGALALTPAEIGTNTRSFQAALASFYQPENRRAYIKAAGLKATL